MTELSGMKARTIAVLGVFAALMIALNLSPLKVPAPYAPFLIYQIWEIPIVVAFVIYGWRIAAGLAVLNTLALLIIFPGALPTGPLYNFAAVLSMIAGLQLVKKFLPEKLKGRREALAVAGLTASGIIVRTIMMLIVNYSFLSYPPPVGYSLPQEVVVLYMPLIALFNSTLALYTIIGGYTIARIAAPAATRI
jgi:riboflavin transporter FmnP